MQLPEPQARNYTALLAGIETGQIKVPQFQREFIWSKEKAARLADSILKGFPIGTFILWRTKEELKTVRNLGNLELPPTPKGDFVQYVLDGQQRLTSLFATVKGLQIEREGRTDDFAHIYVNLDADENGDEDIVIAEKHDKLKNCISMRDLIHSDIKYLSTFPTELHSRLSEYRKRVEGYSFSTIVIQEAPIDVATEVFTRINVSGQTLSMFEIMVAKTFDPDRNFDLAREYDLLTSRLQDVGYAELPSATVLQTISAIIVKECQKKHILSLQKSAVIARWPEIRDSIEHAVDYFRNFFRIPVSKLLPYSALLIPFAYYFSRTHKKPSGKIQQNLQDLFWRVSLSGRYSYSLESRVAQDIKRVDSILDGKEPEYDFGVSTSADFIKSNGRFSTGRSFIKAILCLLAYHQPKSFDNNAIVRIDNEWLKQINSKNYHHFFPRAWLEKLGVDPFESNHVVNITFVDDYLNRREIRAQAPSRYMNRFRRQNDDLAKTMKTHLINLDTFGIWEDDYAKFFDRRAKAISKELEKRVVSRPIDAEYVPQVEDDSDPVESAQA